MYLKVAGAKGGGVGGHKFFVTYLGSVGERLEKVNSDIKILVTQMKMYPPSPFHHHHHLVINDSSVSGF